MRQIRWHQQYLAAFRSRGSSANNHVIAEAAGQLVASCAFPWFRESERWRRTSAHLLERELLRNTFPSGINRELASDYHCFVAELGLVAAVEAEASRSSAEPGSLAAAVRDGGQRGGPARRADCGRLARATPTRAARCCSTPPTANRWPSLLALADALVGRLDWWPRPPADAGSVIVGALMPAQAPDRGQARSAAVAVRRRRDDAAAHQRGENRDLVPVRRRPARVPEHRRARPRRRPVGRGPLRGRGHPGRPRHLLLPRRTRVAFVLPVDDRAQHRRARRPEPVRRRRPVPVGAACARPGDRGHRRRRHRADGPPSTTATPRSTRRPCTAARCCWTGPRAASTSSTRSRAAATTSAWPSTSAPTCRRSSTSPAPSCAGPRQPHPERRGWNCRSGCGGACTGARPTRSSAGTLRAWDAGFPAFTLLGRGRCVPGAPLITRLEFLEARRFAEGRRFPTEPYHGAHPTPDRVRRRRSKRRPDEPAGTGSAQVHPARAAAPASGGVVVVLGILAGGAYAVLNPPMLTSTALVVLPQSAQSAQRPRQRPTAGSNTFTATHEVIASSNPVLSRRLPDVRPAMSLSSCASGSASAARPQHHLDQREGQDRRRRRGHRQRRRQQLHQLRRFARTSPIGQPVGAACSSRPPARRGRDRSKR